MPLPAHEMLSPACPVKPAWAVFDRGWYLRRYADARAICAGKPDEAPLVYYLRVGARLGHSPSALFDEIFYLKRNPDIAELVRGGAYRSGFDHFCQHGHRGVSPHWLFDDELYAALYEDMTLEILEENHCFGRYDHYLKSGQRERRMGQFLFDAMFYRERAIEAGVAAAEIDAVGAYVHFLGRLGVEEELAPSIYFDPAWYVERHPGAKAEIARGRYSCAIEHYLTSEGTENLDPVPQFSEGFYRRRHPDIAAAIEAGMYRSAYQQFVQYGAFELRQPCAEIDLVYYRDMNERVRNDLNSGAVRDAFAHLRLVGLKEGLACRPPEEKPALSEADARAQFVMKARNNLARFARARLDFSLQGAPALAVIMVVFNRFELTMLALSSLRENFAGALELIVFDNDSDDETRRLADYVLGARILKGESNYGFLRGANLALAHVTAPALLFLNNDVELGYGAVPAAMARLASDLSIAAVGGKIIRSNGVLQEAGSIIWNEGTTAGYMRDGAPLAPEANFVRDVDYCSAVFLLCRSEVVRGLGGFDEAFSPAYFEDVDLCVRMGLAGYRVVYDPAVVVHHLEFGSAATTEASMALMRRGRRIFRKKHAGFLQTRLAPSNDTLVQARSVSGGKKILYIEDTVPVRRLGSGFVRSNDVLRAIVAAGFEAHVFPVNGTRLDVMSLLGDMPDGVECLYDRDFTTLPAFLEARRGVYDVVWIGRTHNFARVMPLLVKAGIDPARVPVVLDTEAVSAKREEARAAVEGRRFELGPALRAEFAGAEVCRRILTVNDEERKLVADLGVSRVVTLGTARRAAPLAAGFAARAGLLLVCGMHQADSPNLDSLHWYKEFLLPALVAEMGAAPVLHVVGYRAPEIDVSAFAGMAEIRLHGEVSDLAPFYASARVFVAPARFAAGTPYKIYEAASYGLPCVASDLLVGQLGWGEEILSAPVGDAVAFARQVARVYGDEAEWWRVREAALARVERENGVEGFEATVAEILRGVVEG
jgi:GT2 family glycosyltransferase